MGWLALEPLGQDDQGDDADADDSQGDDDRRGEETGNALPSDGGQNGFCDFSKHGSGLSYNVVFRSAPIIAELSGELNA